MSRRYLSRAAAIGLVLLAALTLSLSGIPGNAPDAARSASAPGKPGKSAAFFSLLPSRLLP